MAAAWETEAPGRAVDVAAALMREPKLWGEDLTAIPTFEKAALAAIADIERLGVRAALASRLL